LDGYERDFRFLVASARRALRQQLDRHEPVAAATGSPRGRALAEHVTEVLQAIEARIGEAEARFAGASTDVERRAATDAMRLVNGLLMQMQEATPWIERASSPELHIGPLYFVDDAARALVGTDCEVVTFPEARYRYATISWPFEPILAHLGRSIAGTRPVVIFYPPEERRSLLLHSLFVHELGHPAIIEHDLLTAVVSEKFSEQAFQDAFTQASDDFVQVLGADPTAATVVMERRLRRWLTELLCDNLAIQYLGPSYLLAFGAMVMSVSASEPAENHPPAALRVRVMLDQLTSSDWREFLRGRIPHTLGWLDHVAAMDLAPQFDFESFLISACTDLDTKIRDVVSARLNTKVYRPDAYGASGEEIEEFLRQRILPAQLKSGHAAPPRGILLAGWLHVLSDQDAEGSEGDAPTSISTGLDNDELQDFLGKALEMSKVLEVWDAS
jgi:hypothetical protein